MMDTTMIKFYSFFHRLDRVDKLRVLYDWHGWWSTFTFFLSSTHLYDLNNAKYVLIHHEDAQDQIKESEMTCSISILEWSCCYSSLKTNAIYYISDDDIT